MSVTCEPELPRGERHKNNIIGILPPRGSPLLAHHPQHLKRHTIEQHKFSYRALIGEKFPRYGLPKHSHCRIALAIFFTKENPSCRLQLPHQGKAGALAVALRGGAEAPRRRGNPLVPFGHGGNTVGNWSYYGTSSGIR